MRVLSMPDKWEYPWFAAWTSPSTPFGSVSRSGVREEQLCSAFEQLHIQTARSGYEWDFTDLNPRCLVAVGRVYNMERIAASRRPRLPRKSFHKF